MPFFFPRYSFTQSLKEYTFERKRAVVSEIRVPIKVKGDSAVRNGRLEHVLEFVVGDSAGIVPS